jgi:hypothetical protein
LVYAPSVSIVSTASWNWAGEPAERVEESRLRGPCQARFRGSSVDEKGG